MSGIRKFSKDLICAIGRDRSGASAVEFALVAPLFFALIFSCFEAGWLVVERTMLERAIDKTTRLVRLNNGEIANTEPAIRKKVCEEALVITDCERLLVLELTPITSNDDFPNRAVPCVDRSTDVRPVTSFDPGKSQQIVFVRACVTVALFTPGLGVGLALDTDERGRYQLKTASAFLNE